MITVKTNNCKYLTQNIYDNYVNSIDFSMTRCSCKHVGLIRHGYYYRTIKFRTRTIILKILRVKCTTCGATHAILLDAIVPYSQISVDVQHSMIILDIKDPVVQNIFKCNTDITEKEYSRINQCFIKYWAQRLASQSFSIYNLLPVLTNFCFNAYKRQFMQIRSRANLYI